MVYTLLAIPIGCSLSLLLTHSSTAIRHVSPLRPHNAHRRRYDCPKGPPLAYAEWRYAFVRMPPALSNFGRLLRGV